MSCIDNLPRNTSFLQTTLATHVILNQITESVYMGWPIQENGFLPHVEYTVIFSFGCKSYKQSGYEGPSPTATPIKFQIHHLESENIHESNLDFTAHFGEINPDILYLCRRVLLGLKGRFCLFSLCSEGADEKIVKSSIFCEKTSKSLRLLSFRP